ncbi:MAG: lipid-A-disaccharide synthase, partial [Planctomycetota bacterium]
MSTLFIIAGEASGDEHGALLVRELKARRPGLRVVGGGGPRMAAAGAEVVVDTTPHATVGIF